MKLIIARRIAWGITGMCVLELAFYTLRFRYPDTTLKGGAHDFGIFLVPGAELVERKRVFWGGFLSTEYVDRLTLRMLDREAKIYLSDPRVSMERYTCPEGNWDCFASQSKLAGNKTEIRFTMQGY